MPRNPGLTCRKKTTRPRLEDLEQRSLLSAGVLDPSFGVGGTVLSDFGDTYSPAQPSTVDSAVDVVLHQGKLLVAGSSIPSGGPGDSFRFALARYNPDGSLDSTFGAGGKLRSPSMRGGALPQAIEVRSDGLIAVVGSTFSNFDPATGGFRSTFSHDFAITTYTAQGAVVNNRSITFNFAFANQEQAFATAFDLSGQLLVGGRGIAGSGLFRMDLATDAIQPFAASGGTFWITDLAVIESGADQGKILAGGFDNSTSHFMIRRYNVDGSLDTSFGTSGTVAGGPIVSGQSQMVVLPSGQILMIGENQVSGPSGPFGEIALERYQSDGSPDLLFGTNGRVGSGDLGVDAGAAFANAKMDALIQSDGKILVMTRQNIPLEVAIVRFHADGSLDTSFGASGIAATSTGLTPLGYGMILDQDEEIVVAGAASGPALGDFLVTRFLNETNVPPVAVANGPYSVSEGGSVVLSSTGSSDPDGSINQFEWDFNYHGVSFQTEATGPAPYFAATTLDGPTQRTIALRVTDQHGATAIATATVTVTNENPTAVLSNNGPVDYGQAARVEFTNPHDPSTADTLAGFRYAFALSLSELDELSYQTAGEATGASFSLAAGTYTVFGRIWDVDNGFTTHETIIRIDKANQRISWAAPLSILEGTPLGASQLNAMVEVDGPDPIAGAITYDPPLGTSLTVGVHVLSVSAAETPNYGPASASVEIRVLAAASLSGMVFIDLNQDGEVDLGENGIAGVTITLSGIDDLGQPVLHVQQTDSGGAYLFHNLRSGSYNITESQPAGYEQGTNLPGTLGGLVAGDVHVINLTEGAHGLNYNYGEHPTGGTTVAPGQAAAAGFWNNRNGQALILSLNGGAHATQLGNWLSAQFPNMYGAAAGVNDLTNTSNDEIAEVFRQKFSQRPGPKLDAQVLATALSVYVTNSSLAGDAGVAYGFTVTELGVGAATFNIGSAGAAFGVPDHTTWTVLDILRATDQLAVNGVLYFDADPSRMTLLRQLANSVYSSLNQQGEI